MDQQTPVGTDLTSIFDDLEEVAARVRKQADAELESQESTGGAGTGTAAGALVADAARQARADLLTAGAQALEKKATPGACSATHASRCSSARASIANVASPPGAVPSCARPACVPSDGRTTSRSDSASSRTTGATG